MTNQEKASYRNGHVSNKRLLYFFYCNEDDDPNMQNDDSILIKASPKEPQTLPSVEALKEPTLSVIFVGRLKVDQIKQELQNEE